MDIIVAVSSDWGIGNSGALLFSIPEDMNFFRETTKGSVIVMGRKTLESFPGGRPLKNRVNIVLTHSESFTAEGVTVCKSIGEVLTALKNYTDKPVFIIGGASVYSEFLPLCDRAYVTKMDITLPADAYFPNLDKHPDWELVCTGDEKTYEGIAFRFTEYRRIEKE